MSDSLPVINDNKYLGIFSNDAIQASINKVREKLADGQSGLVIHADTGGKISASIVQRMGDHISIEAAAIMDMSSGKFDREHLMAQAELIAKW